MSLITLVDPVIFETVIAQLAMLLLTGAGGDMAAARIAAEHMIAAHKPENADEFVLAAEIAGLGLNGIQVAGQAANPDLAPAAVARLLASAISLSRAAHRSRDALRRLRAPKPKAIETKAPEIPQSEISADTQGSESAEELIELARSAIQAANKGQGKAWMQSMRKRQLTQRMADNARKNQERHAAGSTPAAALAQAG